MNTPKEFSVTVYEEPQPFSPVISKSRCRIFYKYKNRNGGFISDEFAEKLLQTLPYTPVKGIYEEIGEDFLDHGNERSEGRIYGIVPENPNFAWEQHVDEDGVTRTYACADVLLFTGLYKEANEITGKAQSMELYEPSIRGKWAQIGGQQYYVYEDACFLGLQALGDEVEPCFEGASFFSLLPEAKGLVEEIKQYNLSQNQKEGGNTKMQKVNFKLSDAEKFDALWTALNPDFNEEGNWTVVKNICSVYDDYAVCINFETGSYERVYYTKAEDDKVELGAIEECFVVDITKEEKATLDAIQKLNGGSFAKAEEVYTVLEDVKTSFAELKNSVEADKEKFAAIEQKNEENEVAISTLKTERDALQTEKTELETSVASLNSEINELKEFKLAVEKKAKEEVIASYSDNLSDEVVDKFTAEMDNFTAEELEKELVFALAKSNPAIFSKRPESAPIPLNNSVPLSGLEAMLEKYKNK